MEYRIQRVFLAACVSLLATGVSAQDQTNDDVQTLSADNENPATEAVPIEVDANDDDFVVAKPVAPKQVLTVDAPGNAPVNQNAVIDDGQSMTTTKLSERIKPSDINQEVFEFGLFAGIINIGDFGSEFAVGITANFQAGEDFFLQYNYLQADVDLSSFENSQGSYFSGDDRTFVHYDLLVGYKLFQGEMFPETGTANLSSLYFVGGVGDTQFGDEENFTYTIGAGYQIAFARKYVLHIDYRNYIYDSSLIRGEETATQNAMFSAGVNYLF